MPDYGGPGGFGGIGQGGGADAGAGTGCGSMGCSSIGVSPLGNKISITLRSSARPPLSGSPNVESSNCKPRKSRPTISAKNPLKPKAGTAPN